MNKITDLIDTQFSLEMAACEKITMSSALAVLSLMEEGVSVLSILSHVREKTKDLVDKNISLSLYALTEKSIHSCFSMLINSDHHERFVAMAAIGTVRIDYFKSANSMPCERCFTRKQDGTLFPNVELKRLVKERASIDALLLSAAKTNDQEAYNQLIKIKSVAERAGIDYIMQFAADNRVTISPSFISAFKTEESGAGVDINNYVGIFKGAISKDALKSALANVYEPTLTPVLGYELFHTLFSRNGFHTQEVGKTFVTRLVQDGGDWFIGLKQHLDGSHAYLGLLTRTRQPVQELDQLVQHGRRKQNQLLVAAILESLPVELILEYASTQPKANAIFRITRLECLKDMVNKSMHLENLKTDLGL